MRLALFNILLLITAATVFADPPATQPSHLPTGIVLHDQNDHPVAPLDLPVGRRAVALIFISTDCPISNGYAPLIGELCHTYAGNKIDFYTVYEDASLTTAAATTHHDAYAYPCDALLDPQQQLAHLAGATVTPEAIVVGPDGSILYRGRIDDQYVSIGHKRFTATTHELKDALSQIASNAPVTVPATQAVGCSIP